MPAKFELIAPCFFGCESTANFELRRIGAEDIRVSDGRLTFKGGAEMIAAANLNLRTVERVMLLLNTYTPPPSMSCSMESTPSTGRSFCPPMRLSRSLVPR